ncbi:MAG: trimeric intracellular cation channel family protein [Candidatus Kapabacteria bacterium]|nr:trimeric intracellular cation channel family protein [Candidatus Kapabacteria bacterium]
MDILVIISLISTFLFGISAAISAIHKRFDLIGIFFISFLSGTGGGIVRDVMLGKYPIACAKDPIYLISIIVSVMVTIIFKLKNHKPLRTFILIDSLGLGSATILGIQKALNTNINPIMSIIFGVISACFGSVIRDILCNETPLLFKKELYASISILGGIVYILLIQFGLNIVPTSFLCVTLIFVFRIISIKYKLTLPRVY